MVGRSPRTGCKRRSLPLTGFVFVRRECSLVSYSRSLSLCRLWVLRLFPRLRGHHTSPYHSKVINSQPFDVRDDSLRTPRPFSPSRLRTRPQGRSTRKAAAIHNHRVSRIAGSLPRLCFCCRLCWSLAPAGRPYGLRRSHPSALRHPSRRNMRERQRPRPSGPYTTTNPASPSRPACRPPSHPQAPITRWNVSDSITAYVGYYETFCSSRRVPGAALHALSSTDAVPVATEWRNQFPSVPGPHHGRPSFLPSL